MDWALAFDSGVIMAVGAITVALFRYVDRHDLNDEWRKHADNRMD
jgi:hypothetical protein